MKTFADQASLSLLCRLFDVARSTVNYKPVTREEEDLSELKVRIITELTTFIGYGVRRMYHHLGCAATRNIIRQAYAEMGLLRPVKKRKVQTTDSHHEHPRFKNLIKDLKITHPNQAWVGDVTYIRINNRWYYVAHLLDAYSRKIVGWAISSANDTSLVAEAFLMAKECGVPQIHHSDQGATYASTAYTKMLMEHGVRLSMAASGAPYENGLSERWNRTLKEEEVDRRDYLALAEAEKSIGEFVLRYNERRIHSSLRYLTPQKIWETYASAS